MATPRDLINNALELIGILAPGETATSDQSTSGLRSLNRMLESWSTENLMIYKEDTEDFSLVAGQQQYSMGPSGDFNTTRPVEIINMTWKDTTPSPDLEIPIQIITQEQWKYTGTKATPSTIPQAAYINYDSPFVYINFYPNPSAVNSVSITSMKELTTYSSLSTILTLPTGWLECLEYNLALRLRPSYGVPLDPEVKEIAIKSKANIKRQNKKPLLMKSEIADLNRDNAIFDYRTGY